jgi:site-specific recombinase XerD
MKNYNEELINNIILGIQNIVDEVQLQQIKSILNVELYGYCINKQETSITVYNDNSNEYALKQFLSAKLVEGKSKKTIERYKFIILKLLDYFPDKNLNDYTVADLRYWLAYYKLKRHSSNTTLDGMRRVVSSFFNWLEVEDYIVKSPARKLVKIKHDTEIKSAFTESQMEKMALNCKNIRDRAIIEMLYATGCRVSELCQIDRSDVNFENMTVLLHGKGNKDRIVPFTDKAKLYLSMYLESRKDNNPALFVTLRKRNNINNRITKTSIELLVKNIGNKAGVEHAHPHRYRSTRITVLLKRGLKIEEVQLISGHASADMVIHYYRSDLEMVSNNFRRVG